MRVSDRSCLQRLRVLPLFDALEGLLHRVVCGRTDAKITIWFGTSGPFLRLHFVDPRPSRSSKDSHQEPNCFSDFSIARFLPTTSLGATITRTKQSSFRVWNHASRRTLFDIRPCNTLRFWCLNLRYPQAPTQSELTLGTDLCGYTGKPSDLSSDEVERRAP